jgi:hypothetical protein
MAGGGKETKRHIFSIPNAAVLYSGESIYSDKPFYNSHSDRPHSDRVNHVGRGIAAGIKEKVLKYIPDLQPGILGAIVNPIKQGYIDKYNTAMHVNLRDAGKVSLPGINSLYSVYAMSWGLTNPDITAIITKEGDDGKEAFLGYEYNGAVVPPDKLGEKALNKEAVKAGVISELMNREIENSDVKDVNAFLSTYAGQEPFIYGARGKRSVLGKDKDGKMIFRYERPSRGEFLKYYLTNDVTYTLLDWAAGTGTSLLGVEEQMFYQGVANEVIKYTQKDYGNRNIGGAPNPFAASYMNGKAA